MQQNSGILQSAFAQTDTITYGAFRVTKAPGAFWKSAKASVGEQEVKLTPFEKRYLALLISQQGAPLTLDILAPETWDSMSSHWFLAAQKKKSFDDNELFYARKELANSVRVLVSNLKVKLEKQHIDPSIIDTIAPVSNNRRAGEKGPQDPLLTAAYYINAPTPL